MSMRIERHADTYADSVTEFLEQPHRLRRRATEQPLLDLFTRHTEAVVATYDPPGIRRAGDSLVFGHIYAPLLRHTATATPDTMPVNKLLAALIAAEVEFRGPLRLSRTQNRLLAEAYERLGPPLVQAGLPAHAALAYRRAGSLYRIDEDTDAEDRCGLAQARARRLAQPVSWKRIGGLFPDLICGYGYRPFRMLWFVVVQLLVFLVAVLLRADQSTADTVFQVLMNYLNPLGIGDTQHVKVGGRAIFVIESYLGAVTMSVFFALLVRRWCRL
ncbi:hypothetical protein [Nocardia seriolae]|nr:hypothetical protein [Nocardia seriolae]MTJ66944.1 hypothetical protein [Nocardia seriolae]MTJ72769.1 hypothetical protein [Nocardia seriolae]MTJ84925.1 hypothetical protein [Nocardia seriolae]MTK28921.1 hypothetical protein [Nocardia seriolae]MTK44890.1 hypothetical protein [Nocardia seriolae]